MEEYRRSISWKKWINPLVKVKDEEGETTYKDSYQKAEEDIPDDDQEDRGPILIGNFGIIPLGEHNDVSKIFNFWVGHCDFPLTEQIAQDIEDVEGVETLEIWTRYRFRVSISKAFIGKVVRNHILKAVQPEQIPHYEMISKGVSLNVLTKYLRESYKFWAVYEDVNQEFSVVKDNSIAAVEDRLNKLELTPLAVAWHDL